MSDPTERSLIDGINCPVLKAAWQNNKDARQEYDFQIQKGVVTAVEVAVAKQRLKDAGELYRLVLEYHRKHVS